MPKKRASHIQLKKDNHVYVSSPLEEKNGHLQTMGDIFDCHASGGRLQQRHGARACFGPCLARTGCRF
ncbi:uncharacterized protein Dvar_21220 [Desulfosarcina variabilis str. Montpellier]